MKDYYSVLGLSREATADEIKRAYRSLAMKHHPDRGGDVAQFQEIQEAYAVLSDPQKKSQYDNPQHPFSQNSHGFDFDTIFDIFGADLRRHRRPSTVRINLWISLRDVAVGGTRVISLQTNGTSSNVEINIPVGIYDGDSVRYPGLSPEGQDLVITYRIRIDPPWQVQGRNVLLEQTVDIWDLILGTDITVEDLTGAQLSLSVPKETQPGTTFRIRGRGLPARQLPGHRNDQPPGDLLVKINARITTPVPNQIIEAVEQYRTNK